ncbi:MAG: hypothetical protein COT84_07560 [Chlamydiae bacterium CG10_big_fil_rev_8_21_14_0_10_35_9]|nr:MAG: hypothetical protein COT84_07560 [Chlamydiae bacterium CG10_big_fil_rev_8_21_14_0_10_35_9]
MTTEKQSVANQANALFSTGPKTKGGKAIVAANPIKHGIFTKDIIISSEIGKESESEYNELLENLKECLMPQNQIESLLVEKIAIDFWRLRRVIRYEAGSIRKYIETLFKSFYDYNKKSNAELNEEIAHNQDYINWIDTYLKCLESGKVGFDQPIWEGEGIESNIADDFCLIAQHLDIISYQEKENMSCGLYSYEKLKALLEENGYSNKKEITNRLLELYILEKQRCKKEISKLEQKKLLNTEADKFNTMLGAIPEEENTDKILKYDRSLQKSIYQNLFLLKKLQGIA